MPQAPPGHSLVAVHGAPTLLPARQRFPPQVVPPRQAPPGHCEPTVHAAPTLPPPTQRGPQSAFELHAVAEALLHVSQKHFFDVLPTARQFGLAASSVRVAVPLVLAIA